MNIDYCGDCGAMHLGRCPDTRGEAEQLKIRLNAIVAQVKGVADTLIEHAHVARRRAEYTSEVNMNGAARRLRAIVAPQQSDTDQEAER